MNIFRRRKRRRLRSLIRGYRLLQRRDNIDLIQELKHEIGVQALLTGKEKEHRLIFGAAAADADLATRQLLMRRIGGLGLNKALLVSLGNGNKKIVHPLPRTWIRVIEKYGFSVSRVRSTVLWYGFMGFQLLRSVQRCWQRVSAPRQIDAGIKKYAYFWRLGRNNLPVPGKTTSYDIFSWYIQSRSRHPEVEMLVHDIPGVGNGDVQGFPLVSVRSPFAGLSSGAKWKLLGKYGKAAGAAILHTLSGKWWSLCMLPEAVDAYCISLVPDNRLARDYLFHNSEWLYRPLWTYEAEKKGARVCLYFYSTNIESFINAKGVAKHTGSWNMLNWPDYIVWNEYQESFLRKQIQRNFRVHTDGPLWFSDSAEDMPVSGGRHIGVFDVSPVRFSVYATLGSSVDYYIPGVVIPFLDDIERSLSSTPYRMAVKLKRALGAAVDKSYASYIKKLGKRNNVLLIPPGISAFRMIETCDAVISLPFTSTAITARAAGKPSVYYDPSGMIHKDDPGAHGIEILSGAGELKQWLDTIILKEKSKVNDGEMVP